ncbi:hypothetical protein [Hydrogenophaga sp. PAMC20947]|uniref:hypothetical protein n=1 Tax=Hydrogenophaga sp. PAMC20947 TaxID=2565558 RepID=UPI00109DDB25|nr:hypothetical protein [Hydrogenophaga sp. PAMC20947]QCB45907.1 hypothetical protein E5678_07685 [Hydrogenophaga sp. PAMC20947]
MTSPADVAPASLPEGRMEGREAFVDLIRSALACAAREGWTPLVLSDADFADWPLGERAVLESLNAWATSGRQLHFLAKDFNVMRDRHPRLVQWRTTWSHLVDARVCSGAAGEGLPSALWTPRWTMERLDTNHCTLVASTQTTSRVALRERLDACWHRGSPGFPASVLGL